MSLTFALLLFLAAEPACGPDQVSAHIGAAGAGMCHNYQEIVFRNRSSRSCVLTAMPRIRLFDDYNPGKTVPASVHGPASVNAYGAGSNHVTLAPAATTAMTVVTLGPCYDKSRCATHMRMDFDRVRVKLKVVA